jgi:hypothetical protein
VDFLSLIVKKWWQHPPVPPPRIGRRRAWRTGLPDHCYAWPVVLCAKSSSGPHSCRIVDFGSQSLFGVFARRSVYDSVKHVPVPRLRRGPIWIPSYALAARDLMNCIKDKTVIAHAKSENVKRSIGVTLLFRASAAQGCLVSFVAPVELRHFYLDRHRTLAIPHHNHVGAARMTDWQKDSKSLLPCGSSKIQFARFALFASSHANASAGSQNRTCCLGTV